MANWRYSIFLFIKLRKFIELFIYHFKSRCMNYLQRLEYWGEAHHPKYMDIVRIAFGIFLCIKGIEFANNSANARRLRSRVFHETELRCGNHI